MKKKALIIFLSLILVILATLFFLRHEIIGHVFKISISEKTRSTVELNIGHLYYDIFSSTVTLKNSDLSFNNIYVNKEKTVVLSDFNFNELRLVNLSIIKLIFKHEVIAAGFIIDTPSLWFQEDNNPRPFKEKPKEIIKSLKKHPDLLGDLKIVVGEIEIIHGKVDLTSIIDEDENKGSVEFKLLLKDINTAEESIFNESSFLFAKHHLFKLSKFNYSLPNGDLLSFDSLVFGSDSNMISISNLNLNIKDSSAHSKFLSTDVKLASLKLFGVGMEDMDSLRDLVIDSLELSDGYVRMIKSNAGNTHKNDSVSKKPIFPKILNSVSLTKLILDNINIDVHNQKNDTLLEIEGLDFQVDGFFIDSVSLSKGKPSYSNQSIRLGLEEFRIKDLDAGLIASFSDLELDERNKLLHIYNVHINDSISGEHSFLIDMEYLTVDGVSIDEQLHNQEMKLAIKVSNPKIEINIENLVKKSNKGNSIKLDNIIVDKIDVINGNIHFSDKKNLDINILGLNIKWDSIGFRDHTTIDEINANNLNLEFSKLKYQQLEKQTLFESGYTSVTNNDFQINSIKASLTSRKVVSDFRIDKIIGKGTDLEKLISKNEINFKSILISQPIIKAKINKDENRKASIGNHKSDTRKFTLDIDDFRVEKGDLDLKIESDNTISIKSDFYINTSNIVVNDFSNTRWLHNLNWDINLFNTKFENQDFKILCTRLLSNKKAETFSALNVTVEHVGLGLRNHGFEIIDVSIPEIVFEGIDYNSFIDQETPMVKSATIKDAYLDLNIESRASNNKIESNTSGAPKLPFELDELNLDNFKLNLNKRDSLSTTNYSIGELDIKYSLDSATNLVDDLRVLRLKDFSTSNIEMNSFLKIKNIENIDSVNGLSIYSLNVGNLVTDSSANQHSVEFNEIDFVDIFIGHSLPLNINLGEIGIRGVNARIQSKSAKDNPRKATISDVKMPRILDNIGVDQLSVSGFDLYHTTLTDSTNKRLELKNIGVNITALYVDSSTFSSPEYTFARSASIYLGDNSFVSKDSLYTSSLKSITYHFQEQKIVVDSIKMMPRYDDELFFKKAVYQTGRMKLNVASLVCSNFRINSLIEDEKLHIGSIDAYGLNLDIFRNKLYEMNPNAYKKMPQEAILDIKQTLIIDSLKAHDGFIQYMEIQKKSVVPGKLFLDRFNVGVYNINNDLSILDNSSFMKAKLDARLLGQADLRINAVFPILSPSNDFWFSGHMDRLDFPELNNLTENLVGVTMARGYGSLDIPLITGNSIYSEGSILFKYNKLKIELYNREKAQIQKGLTGGMASLLLNDVFIRSNNPGFLGKTRPGEVYFKRNTQKSIVAFMWKSIMSGLMSTMGYNNKEQRQEKRAWKKSNNKQ